VQDGSTGTLIAPGDTAALGTALERYVADVDLRRSHGEAGVARVRREFSLEGMMRRYCELYDDVLRQRAPHAVH
jgi:glycosyltransferase involved in cell wall biosynthesis